MCIVVSSYSPDVEVIFTDLLFLTSSLEPFWKTEGHILFPCYEILSDKILWNF